MAADDEDDAVDFGVGLPVPVAKGPVPHERAMRLIEDGRRAMAPTWAVILASLHRSQR